MAFFSYANVLTVDQKTTMLWLNQGPDSHAKPFKVQIYSNYFFLIKIKEAIVGFTIAYYKKNNVRYI